MPRFVRCIEGHVFDAEAAGQCPICGAIFEVKPSASADVAPAPAAAAVAPNRSLIVALVAVLGIGLGAGAVVYVLRGSGTAITAANTSTPPAEKTKEKSDVDAAPTPVPPAASKVATVSEPSQKPATPPSSSAATPAASTAAPNVPGPANAAPAPKVAALPESNQRPVAPSPPTTSGMSVSNTLQTALDVARMLVTFNQRDYPNTYTQAEVLAGQNNPVALFILGGLLEGGLAGHQDITRARASFTAAVDLGEPNAALFLGRMLEGGIGGPPDLEKAKQLYLFAARSMVSAADQELVRLHLDGARGMTVLEAYQKLMAGSPGASPNAAPMDAINQLYNSHSTTALCLHGWLLHEASAKGWAAVRNGGEVVSDKYSTSDAVSADTAKAGALKDFERGAVRSDPWCEWGMATLAAEGVSGYPKNQVEADVFYRLAAMNRRLGASDEQVKQQMASLESKMTSAEKAQADGLFHSAVPSSVAP
jgi:hypothetical protein